MSKMRYTEEFKVEAVKQVTERGHPVADVAKRLGTSHYSLYQWLKLYAKPAAERAETQSLSIENRRLKSELKRVTEVRDILKKAAAFFKISIST
jgi:transposase